jgi:probable phosphoglycerate mutase
MRRLTLVRHGQTDWNLAGRIQGHTDIDLNDTGRWQAQRLAERLAGERFDRVLCSDARRARQTLAPYAQASGCAIEFLPQLRERHFGAFEGQTYESLARGQPQAFARLRSRDIAFDLDGGESLVQLRERIVTVLELALGRAQDSSVLIVTHGGVLDLMYRYFLAMPLETPRQAEQVNAALNRVSLDQGRFRIDAWADAAHLDPDAGRAGLPGQAAVR